MKTRFAAALVLLSILLGSLSCALGESIRVYVSANSLKVYKMPAASSSVLGVMAYGEDMLCLAANGDWARVQNAGGAIGYCKISSLSKTDPNELSDKVYLAESASVHRRPDTASSVMMTAAQGASYTAVAITEDGDWYRLKNGRYYGYVESEYISYDPVEDGNADPTAVYVVSNTLNVYKDAATTTKLLGTMCFGDKLALLATAGGWAKVKNSGGSFGYCKLDGLSTANPCKLDKTGYAKADGVPVRKKPLADAAVIKTLSAGDGVRAVAFTKDEGWARVYLSSGSYGFVEAKHFSSKPVKADQEPDKEPSEQPGDGFSSFDRITGYAKATKLTIYAAPDEDAEVLGSLSFGESIAVNGKAGSWLRVISSSGKTGYAKAASLTKTNPNTYSTTLYAKADGVKLYRSAATSSEVLGTAKQNTVLTGVAISSDKEWVRLKNGSEYAYAQADKLSTKPQEAAPSAAVKKLLSVAEEQLSKKYVYGATGPSQFDCSGFTQYVFKKAAGVSLKRTAQQQGYDSRYEKISASKLKAGDLVFFNTNNDDSDDCDHVGIYIGSGKFVHASSAGGKVMVSSLTSGYYNRTFSWGRRAL